jgi:hypothetical protein
MWITKYALSGGLIKMSAPQVDSDGYVKDAFKKNDYRVYKLGNDVFDSEAAAKDDAEKRRIKKIASLRVQIAKLQKMTF